MHKNVPELIQQVYLQHELVTSERMKVMEEVLLKRIYGLIDIVRC